MKMEGKNFNDLMEKIDKEFGEELRMNYSYVSIANKENFTSEEIEYLTSEKGQEETGTEFKVEGKVLKMIQCIC
jgi:hypothetical protein